MTKSKADTELDRMNHDATFLRTAIEYALSGAFEDPKAAIAWLRAWHDGDKMRQATRRAQ